MCGRRTKGKEKPSKAFLTWRGALIYGRFWRPPTPASGWSHYDAGLSQVAGRRLAANAHRFLNLSKRPSQSPQGYDWLSLVVAQDVAHIAEGIALRPFNVLTAALYMAGFQVIMYGRFWVFTEKIGIKGLTFRHCGEPSSPIFTA